MQAAWGRSNRATMAALGVAVLAVLLTVAPGPASAQDEDFGDLGAERVVDATGTSLSEDEVGQIEQRLDDLEAEGVTGVAYVRALDADPDDTLDQVEELHERWADAAGADPDTAVAFLINRNPDDPNDARAAIFVGTTLHDDAIPSSEQEDIVDEALIPPLRDGDVAASFLAGIDRVLVRAIEGPPPPSAAEVRAAEAATSWLPVVGVLVALVLTAAALRLFGRRTTADVPEAQATLTRPGDLPPAVAAAVLRGAPQLTSVSATILDLAARGALVIEPGEEGGRFSDPAIRIRLADRIIIQGPTEESVWATLEEHAEAGVVSSKALQSLGVPKPVRTAVTEEMQRRDWLNPEARRPRIWLTIICTIATAASIATFVVMAIGSEPIPSVFVAAGLLAVAIMAGTFAATYSPLSVAGQTESARWRAYLAGIETAAKDEDPHLDLDAVLADAVAFGVDASLSDRLEAASEAGVTLRAFSGAGHDAAVLGFPWWVAFTATTRTSADGGSSATVSGASAGGGGGAAGST